MFLGSNRLQGYYYKLNAGSSSEYRTCFMDHVFSLSTVALTYTSWYVNEKADSKNALDYSLKEANNFSVIINVLL